MTTRTETADVLRLSGGGFAWRRSALAFLVTLLAIFLFATAFAIGYARLHDGRLLPGVEIGGVAVGGLERAAAQAKLRQTLPALDRGQLTISIADTQRSISYAELGRDYEMSAMLDQALGVGRAGTPFEQLANQISTLVAGVNVPLQATFDAELLAERVAAIASAAESAPVDATISRPGGEYVVTPAVEGRAVDEREGVRLAMAALGGVAPGDASIELPASAIPPTIATEQAQSAADRANAISAESLRITAGGTTATIEGSTIRGWVRLDEAAPGDWSVVLEDEPIAQFVDQFKFEFDVPATNATYTFESATPVVISDAPGQEIEREPATSAITEALTGRAGGAGSTSVNLSVIPVAPEFRADQAQALVSRIERLSRWTTRYHSSARNGNGQNIRRPTNLIDGTVIGPGEEFDFVDIAGPITARNGYTSGAAIIRGNTRLDGVLGGGLCSCSTTIFNAALRAGFEIGARRNHSYYIDRYPVGLDATIWISGSYVQTMEFINDSQYPILVRGINRPGRVTFEIYGVPDGRRVKLSEARIWNERPTWTRFEYTDELPPGLTERLEWPVAGFNSEVTRTVTAADGSILHEDVYRSDYRRVVGHVLVGRELGDPPAGTIEEPNKPIEE